MSADPHKTGSVNSQSGMERFKALLNCWLPVDFRGGAGRVLRYAHSRGAHQALVDGSKPMFTQMFLIKLSGSQKGGKGI